MIRVLALFAVLLVSPAADAQSGADTPYGRCLPEPVARCVAKMLFQDVVTAMRAADDGAATERSVPALAAGAIEVFASIGDGAAVSSLATIAGRSAAAPPTDWLITHGYQHLAAAQHFAALAELALARGDAARALRFMVNGAYQALEPFDRRGFLATIRRLLEATQPTVHDIALYGFVLSSYGKDASAAAWIAALPATAADYWARQASLISTAYRVSAPFAEAPVSIALIPFEDRALTGQTALVPAPGFPRRLRGVPGLLVSPTWEEAFAVIGANRLGAAGLLAALRLTVASPADLAVASLRAREGPLFWGDTFQTDADPDLITALAHAGAWDIVFAAHAQLGTDHPSTFDTHLARVALLHHAYGPALTFAATSASIENRLAVIGDILRTMTGDI